MAEIRHRTAEHHRQGHTRRRQDSAKQKTKVSVQPHSESGQQQLQNNTAAKKRQKAKRRMARLPKGERD